MRENDVDVTLRCGDLTDSWLSSWLFNLASGPGTAKAVVTNSTSVESIIELQDERGVAVGGILYLSPRGSVRVLAAADTSCEPSSKKRSLPEMRMALDLAIDHDKRERELVRLGKFFKYASLPVAILLIALSSWVWVLLMHR